MGGECGTIFDARIWAIKTQIKDGGYQDEWDKDEPDFMANWDSKLAAFKTAKDSGSRPNASDSAYRLYGLKVCFFYVSLLYLYCIQCKYNINK